MISKSYVILMSAYRNTALVHRCLGVEITLLHEISRLGVTSFHPSWKLACRRKYRRCTTLPRNDHCNFPSLLKALFAFLFSRRRIPVYLFSPFVSLPSTTSLFVRAEHLLTFYLVVFDILTRMDFHLLLRFSFSALFLAFFLLF